MEHLFSPIEAGSLRLKNRIIMPAMHLNYTPDGKVSKQLISFYEERAKGGVALIVIGGCRIDEFSGGENMVDISDDSSIPGLKELTDSIHHHNALIAAQLYHAGGYAPAGFIGRQAIAPSSFISKFTKEESREMTKHDIVRTIKSFADAAERAKKAGFNAVEILAAGYLISQFLTQVTNKRTDKYGGKLENRMRFGLEVVDAVRSSVGKNFTVMIRLSGNDFIPGGNTTRETKIFAAELEKHGIDAFNITGGWHETRVPQITMDVPHAAFSYLAQCVKSVTTKPVVACNRIHSPLIAEQLIKQGSSDIVGLARELIADPYLPNKAKENRTDEIIPCIGCNQGCFDHIFELKPIECMVNPRAGHEFEIPPIKKTSSKKKVMVIGGGAAGLSVATTASLLGHEVSLYEKTNVLGGQLHIAGALRERNEFASLANALIIQAKKSGITIHCDIEADATTIKNENPDVVVVATGGCPTTPPIRGIDRKNVVQAWDVLAGKSNVGKDVVVIGGGAVGIEVATYIAKMGTIDAETLQFLFLSKAENIDTIYDLSTKGIRSVKIIEMSSKVGIDIGISTRWVALQQLKRYGVIERTNTRAKEITSDGVLVEFDGNTELIKCNTVVLAVGTRPVNNLNNQLREIDERVIIIGDAKKPRKAYDAIHEGFYAARHISSINEKKWL